MKKSIVIVEDEPAIAEAESLILSEQYNVHVANDGEEGLKLVKEIKPDLVLLDLMLPQRGGYDVCYQIRQNDSLTDVKILMVTAKNQKIDMDKGMLVGTDSYLTKPFEPEELLERVTTILKD